MKLHVYSILVLINYTTGYYHRDVGIPEAERIKTAEETALRTSRIVGGYDANPTQYPFFAGLIIAVDVNITSVCGASLISNTKLLTAAHCWNDGARQAILLEVVLGSAFLFFGGTRIVTNDVITHTGYDVERMQNDIAIITTPKVEFTAYIQPINLPMEKMHEDNCKVIGFGRTSDETPLSIDQHLSEIKLNIIDNAECSLTYGPLITDSLVCTSGNEFKGPCGGDSGGPMFYTSGEEHVLVGVVSFGSSYGCEAGHPTSYTRISSFLDWIHDGI